MSCSFKCSHRIGMFLVMLFILCFTWSSYYTASMELQLQLYQILYFKFTGLNLMSFVSGLVQSYIWGYVFPFVWFLSGKVSRKD